MSKFLNEEGLSYFWGKVKDFLKSKYVAIGDAITVGRTEISDGKIAIGTTANITDSEISLENSDGSLQSTTSPNGLIIKRNNKEALSINNSGVRMESSDEKVYTSMTPESLDFYSSDDLDKPLASIGPSELRLEADDNSGNRTVATAESISSPKIVKKGGTAVQILMADGSVKTLNAANGVPTLDANGKIPLEQLGNIDTTLFQVVTALPTTGIVKNRIYLVKSSCTTTQNIYAEYIYTGDVSATYDASKWEKLGEYKSDVDLSGYSKKSQTVNSINYAGYSNEGLLYRCTYADGVNAVQPFLIPKVEYSTGGSGLMSASDKKALDTLAARYPLSIASLAASPNLLEVGKSSDITFSWSFNNTDFHPITAQTIAVDGAAAVTVDKANKSYKQTALAGATTATTKSAVLKVNDSLTKSVNITYHYPSYIGVVANGATVDATAVKALTKSIEWGKGKTSAISQTNQKIVYAYPVSYGDLTSIKDGNGFQGFSGYTKQTLTIDGQNYNVYVQNIAATSSSTYTFA